MQREPVAGFQCGGWVEVWGRVAAEEVRTFPPLSDIAGPSCAVGGGLVGAQLSLGVGVEGGGLPPRASTATLPCELV